MDARVGDATFRAAIDAEHDAVLVASAGGTVLYANASAGALFEHTLAELRGTHVRTLVDHDIDDWTTTRRIRLLGRGQRSDGSRFTAEIVRAPLVDSGSLAMRVLFVRDVSQQVRITRMLRAYSDITEAMLSGSDRSTVLPLIALHARSIFEGVHAAILGCPATNSDIEVRAAVPPTPSERFPLGQPVEAAVRRVVLTGRGTSIPDTFAPTPMVNGWTGSFGPAMFAPIEAGGSFTASVLLVAASTGDPDFGRDAVLALERYAERAGFVLTLDQARHDTEENLRRTADQLQHALDSRIVIEQAKGMIAQQRDVDVEEAFRLLRHYARSHSAKIHDVAHAVVRRRLLV